MTTQEWRRVLVGAQQLWVLQLQFFGGRGLGEDRAERGGDVVGLGLEDVGEQVAGEVDPAPLMSGTLEAAPQRGHQARVLVGDHQPHLGQAALLDQRS